MAPNSRQGEDQSRMKTTKTKTPTARKTNRKKKGTGTKRSNRRPHATKRKQQLVSKIWGLNDLQLLRLTQTLNRKSTAIAEQFISNATELLLENKLQGAPENRGNLKSEVKSFLTESWGQNYFASGRHGAIDLNDPDWETITGRIFPPQKPSEQNLDAWRNDARWLYLFNPLYRGLIDIFVCYSVGQEVEVNVTHDNKIVQTKGRDSWSAWARREGSDFQDRAEEFVSRTLRDGECLYSIRNAGDDGGARDRGPGQAIHRFLEPENLKQPEKHVIDRIAGEHGLSAEKIAERSFTFGVETLKDDPEHVFAYWFETQDGSQSHWVRVEANNLPDSRIRHIKTNCSRNSKRGVPMLLTVSKTIRAYDTWQTARQVLNQVRSAIAMVVYRKSSVPGDIEAAVEAEADSMDEAPTGDDSRPTVEIPKRLIDLGMTINAPMDTEIDFKSPNVQAKDAESDGHAILRLIAVGLGLPDYMVTGDASATSFASQQVAEARGVITLLCRQKGFGRQLARIVRDTIRIESDLSEEEVDELKIEVKGPNIIIRDPLDLARSLDILSDAGIISKKTARTRADLKHEEEEKNIADEQTENPEAAPDVDLLKGRQ
ncbi:MAG: phage portal protein [Phycisphaerales bacterium]|nr:phage portal protein [Phycisphaerales bacterium]